MSTIRGASIAASSDWQAAPRANSNALVARLPDEILQDIFYICSEWPACFPLAYSHVCFYWRDLALASPKLWTFIHLTNRSDITRLREFLARSGDTFLHVKFTQYGIPSTTPGDLHNKAQLLADHSFRIRAFETDALYQPQMSSLSPYFSSLAPQLRYLRVHGIWQLYSTPILFQNHVPSLRRLCLHNITAQWLSCKNLTELDISSYRAPSAAALLQTLRDSPSLVHLRLQFRSPLRTAGNGHGDLVQVETIELAGLRDLYLCSFEHHDVIDILSCLSFPPTTKVSLRFEGVRRSPIHILQHCPSLRALVAKLKDAMLDLSSPPGWPCEIALQCGEQLSVRWEWEWTDEIINNRSFLCRMAFAALPIQNLRHLHIRVMGLRMFETEWLTLLSHVPTVRSITLEVFYASQVLSFLDSLAPQDPNLGDEREENLERLVVCFEARAAQSARLHLLAFRMHSSKPFPPTLLSRLEDVVEEVQIWVESSH
ncbi:hypothetical protein B0H21DRAFT_541953 [Amylocystis lapponica]|nr:hypothetical protein B0H21DRAFT_541953 [Amylocystis lapponica]